MVRQPLEEAQRRLAERRRLGVELLDRLGQPVRHRHRPPEQVATQLVVVVAAHHVAATAARQAHRQPQRRHHFRPAIDQVAEQHEAAAPVRGHHDPPLPFLRHPVAEQVQQVAQFVVAAVDVPDHVERAVVGPTVNGRGDGVRGVGVEGGAVRHDGSVPGTGRVPRTYARDGRRGREICAKRLTTRRACPYGRGAAGGGRLIVCCRPGIRWRRAAGDIAVAWSSNLSSPARGSCRAGRPPAEAEDDDDHRGTAEATFPLSAPAARASVPSDALTAADPRIDQRFAAQPMTSRPRPFASAGDARRFPHRRGGVRVTSAKATRGRWEPGNGTRTRNAPPSGRPKKA